MFTNGFGPGVFKFTLKGHCLGKALSLLSSKFRLEALDNGPGVRLSKVPITFRARNQIFNRNKRNKKSVGPD